MARAITAWKKTKIIRIGGIPRRVWKIKPMPKLRILKNIASPELLLSKAKNAYVDLMLRAGNMNTAGSFGNKRVPTGRQVKFVYPSEEFDRGCRFMRFTRTF
jgi:hypothetical protein